MSDHAAGMLALADARTTLTAFAESLARWLHRDEVDKQGHPYVGHLERVAAAVALDGGSETEIAAAWLHDALEDSPIKEGALRYLLPHNAFLLVRRLTRFAGAETYDQYIKRLGSSGPAAVRVKVADLRDNLDASRGPIPDSLRKRYEKALARLESQR